MTVKFSTKNSAMDYFRYVRKNALIMVSAGIVFGIAGLAAGIAFLAVAGNIPGGIVLLFAGILIATGLIIYGLYGLKKQFLRNTLITGLESNDTEFNENCVKITQTGNGIRVDKEYGYMHIARIIEDNECYQIELNNNNLILCTKQSMVDGSVDELDAFLEKTLANKFINRSKPKLTIISLENSGNTYYTDSNIECDANVIDSGASDTDDITESEDIASVAEANVDKNEADDNDTNITQ